MKKNQIRRVIIHGADNLNFNSLSDKINEFHIEVIERRLNQLSLTKEQKNAVINRIIDNLKLREVNGVIK